MCSCNENDSYIWYGPSHEERNPHRAHRAPGITAATAPANKEPNGGRGPDGHLRTDLGGIGCPGGECEVVSIITKPNTDPHVDEPSAADAPTLARADA
jgi:hypothetical protein